MTLMIDGHRFEAVVFDFDGVLADTAEGWAAAEAALCANYGVQYTDTLAARTHGVGLDDSVRHLTAEVHPPVRHHEAAALMRAMAEQHVPPRVEPIAGGIRTVETLASQVPVGIASNTELPLLEHLVTELGLDRVVRTIVAASEVPSPKPAPDVYLEAAHRLGSAPAATLAVEDSLTGGRAAAAAGCVVLALQLPGAPAAPDLSWALLHASSHADLRARIVCPNSCAPDSVTTFPGPVTNVPDTKDPRP